jgi:hypothetical protein
VIIRLTSDQITAYWDHVKFAALSSNRIVSSDKAEEYCRGLLKNLLSEKYQCWMCIDDSTRAIKSVAVTGIHKNMGDVFYLLIEAAYGFIPAAEEDKDEWLSAMRTFGKEVGCDSVMAYTSNQMAENVMIKMGMVKVSSLYQASIGD